MNTLEVSMQSCKENLLFEQFWQNDGNQIKERGMG